jgi:hypothetical protein
MTRKFGEWGATISFQRTEAPGPRIANPRRCCGLGADAGCCIYITGGSDGMRCERATAIGEGLRRLKPRMSAQWEPTAPFPKCQKENMRARGKP